MRARRIPADAATRLVIALGLFADLPIPHVWRRLHGEPEAPVGEPGVHFQPMQEVGGGHRRGSGRGGRGHRHGGRGLGSLPGGGAEIFHEDIRSKLCDYKADADQWLRVHREWHELGGRSNATMLYGHIEQPEHRLDHMIRLRELQDITGGFQTFIPLAFHPTNNPLGANIPKPSGVTDLKVMALSRLMLDNFPHIKAYWQMLSARIAQVAQSYGADDIDGTVVHETIYHAAGSDSPQELTVRDLRRLIEEAGRVPVERDTLYHEVVRAKPVERKWATGRKLEVVS